jgi:hypothetical protein
VRKLLLLGIAALFAFRGGKGLSQQPHSPAAGAGGRSPAARSQFGLGGILSLLFAPRWLRPFMIARALIPARRRPPIR